MFEAAFFQPHNSVVVRDTVREYEEVRHRFLDARGDIGTRYELARLRDQRSNMESISLSRLSDTDQVKGRRAQNEFRMNH